MFFDTSKHNEFIPQLFDSRSLAKENIFVWHGHNYALEAVRLMGLEESGGVIRIGQFL